MEEEKEQLKQQRMSKGRAATDDGEEMDEFGEYLSNGNESLLSLVQPEMKMLSRHWLAALKDHALLSLPQGKATRIDNYFVTNHIK